MASVADSGSKPTSTLEEGAFGLSSQGNSESMFQALVEQAPDGIVIVEDDKVVYRNPVLAELFGKEADGTESFIDHIAIEDRERASRLHDDWMSGTARDSKVVVRVVDRHGRRVPLEATCRAIQHHGRGALMVILRDISDRVVAEAAEEASLRQLNKMIDIVADAIVSVDKRGRIIQFNRAAEQAFGYTAAEVLGKNLAMLVPARFDERHREQVKEFSRGGDRSQIMDHNGREVYGRRKGGSEFPAEATVAVVETAVGSVSTAILRDISERKAAEERLLRVAALVDAAPFAMVSTGRDGVVTSWNPAAERLYGYSAAEMIGMPREIIVPPGLTSATTVAWDEIIQDGRIYTNVETRRMNRAGELIDVLITAFPLRDSEGNIVGGTSVATDMREVVLEREELRRSRTSLAEAQRIARMGNWDWNIVTNDLFWSDEIYRIFGLHPREFGATYAAFLDRVHPDDRAFVERAVDRAVNHAEPYSIDHRIVWPDGSVRVVHEVGEVTFADGGPVHMTGTVQDVTQIRAAEAELRRQRDLLGAVLGGAPLVIFATDRAGVFTLSDGRALSLLGLEPGQAVGSSAFELYAEIPSVVENLRRTLRGETVSFSSQIGDTTFDALYAPLFDEGGEVTGAVGVAFDTSERARLERQLMLAQKMEGLGRLAGGIAHDFNNLLTAIISYSEFIAESLAPHDERADDIQEVLSAARRAALLTRQLLTFARRQPGEPVVVDPSEVTSGLGRMLERLIGEHIELRVGECNAACLVRIDASQLEQVIVNLAVNARDAMPAGGSLTISTAPLTLQGEAATDAGLPAGDYVAISVCDTGQGMTASVREHIFEPFFTTKELGKGTGLGLSTCYGIVQQANGAILVESEPGQGSTFTVLLPRVEGEASLHRPATPLSPAKGSGTVLLVEDELPVRTLLARVLQRAGYTVIEAATPLDALAILESREGPVDLLLTDLVMPQMGGAELAAKVLGRQPGVRVLYMSGYTDNADLEIPGQELAFIAKPFTPAELAEKVRAVLDATAPVSR